TAAIGSSRLAGLLAARGVTVDRVTRSSDALVAANRGDVTLLLPAPGLMHAYYLRMLKLLPATTRVVLVEPSGLTLDQGLIPVGRSGNRWATKAVPPGCNLPEAVRAGAAGVYHVRYGDVDGQTVACYQGAAPPSLGTGGSPDPDFPVNGGQQEGSGSGGGIDGGGSGSGGDPPTPPYWKLLPPWAWAVLGMLGLAGVAFALARARRLGPPVSEPLPVAVRAAETVEGRGLLYRRANARQAALATLRASTLSRLP